VSVLPSIQSTPQAQLLPAPKPQRGGGYTLSEHVKQYYKTAHV